MQCIQGGLAKALSHVVWHMVRHCGRGTGPCEPCVAPLILQFEHDTYAISVLTSLVGKGHMIMTVLNRLGMCSSSTRRGARRRGVE